METRNPQPFRLQLSVETTAVVLCWAGWIIAAYGVFLFFAVLIAGDYPTGVPWTAFLSWVVRFLVNHGGIALVLLGLSAIIRAIGSLKPKAE
ncbi:MAG: hypothetical protein ACYSUC_04395 [Planctomycetota bacterium]|jgi:hypothetical protein